MDLHSPSITDWTCFMMISFAMVAGQSSTMCFTDSLSTVSSCLMNWMASSEVLIFLAVCMENVGEPNASWVRIGVLVSFPRTKLINLGKFNFYWSECSRMSRNLRV